MRCRLMLVGSLALLVALAAPRSIQAQIAQTPAAKTEIALAQSGWVQEPSSASLSPREEQPVRVYRLLGSKSEIEILSGEFEMVLSDAVLDRGLREGFAALSAEQLDQVRSRGVKAFEDERAAAVWRGAKPSEVREAVAAWIAQRGSGGIAGFPCYRTVEETYSDLAALAAANPALATWIDLGDSWEGSREIRALRVTNSASSFHKAPFLLIAATHAREYTTAETVTRFAEELVNGFGVDPEITAILNTTEIHIVPIHNPDGRKKAEVGTTNWWRKNTNDSNVPATGPLCDVDAVGVDLNRNSGGGFWQFGTDGFGYSTYPCSEIYSGPSLASEPETVAIEALMEDVFVDQRDPAIGAPAPPDTEGLFISVHSSGQWILFPWEHQFLNPPNHDDLRSLGRRMGHHLPGYSICQDCLSSASGTNVDEAYSVYGVAAYTYELGTTFHQACSTGPTNFEDDIWPQTAAALTLSAKAARRPYQEPKGPQIRDVLLAGGPVTAGTSVAISGVADDTMFSELGDPAMEPQEVITAVYYSIDDPPWTVGLLDNLNATDGAYNDEVVEEFDGVVDTTGLLPGTHLVYLVAEDASGQKGLATAVFLEIEGPLFADGFETGDTSLWSSATP